MMCLFPKLDGETDGSGKLPGESLFIIHDARGVENSKDGRFGDRGTHLCNAIKPTEKTTFMVLERFEDWSECNYKNK